MTFLYALIFFVVAAVLSVFLGSRDWQFVFIALATSIGFLFGKVFNLSKELKQLRKTMAEDWELRNSEESDQVKPQPQPQPQPQPRTEIQHISEGAVKPNVIDEEYRDLNNTQSSGQNNKQDSEDVAHQQEYLEVVAQAAEGLGSNSISQRIIDTPKADAISSSENISSPEQNKQTQTQETQYQETSRNQEALNRVASKANASDGVSLVKKYFTGGNIFVRVGIIILFFGVSFLLKYVSDRGFFPIEYRLIGVIIGAMFLLGLGWRLRHKNETYALLLQGAGIGVLYLDIFAAYNLYQLIPPIATFALLFVVSMFSAALAVLQDSKSLAVLGFSGGFIAPILASSGSNNHVGLFSYYAVLNVAIVGIAWFKAWRALNLLGFLFTFIIGTAWGVLSYNSAKFSTTEPFLIIFFIFYVLIAVLYALRQPPKLKGYVDGTLLFGVPLAASSLQYYLVKDYEYGVSISSFAMGAFYILLSWFIWKRKGEGLKLLSEAFLALGVIFASMAIPFALAPTQTAAAWALEGIGLIWLGLRQDRLSVRMFGVLLQLAAGFIYLIRFNYEPNAQPFLNGEFISTMMLAVSGIVSARLLISPFAGKKSWEGILSPVLLVWGLLWLLGGFSFQTLDHFSDRLFISTMLVFTALVTLLLSFIGTRVKPLWRHAFIAAFTLFIVILFLAFIQFVYSFFDKNGFYHPSIYYGWFAWPVVFGAYYFLLYQAQKYELFPRFQRFFHTVLLLFAVALITIEGSWWAIDKFYMKSGWLGIWYAVPSTLAMWLIIKAKVWPFNTHSDSYTRYSGSILSIALAIWSLIALVDKGTSDPLPWLPILNPLDIMLIIVFITLFKWWQSIENLKAGGVETAETRKLSNENGFNKNIFVIVFGALTFLWLNFSLFRIAHHWFGVPYIESAMYASSLVQASVSILWALTGVILTLFASHKNNRLLWVTGALLLGLVVLKLFIIDLSALGSLGRIISFLVVGVLLTSIGYFAPLPEKEEGIDNNDNAITNDDNEK